MSPILTIPLWVTEGFGCARSAFPVSRGVPLPAGAVREPVAVRLTDADGRERPVQTRRLTRWPDGSVKWLLVDFQADVAAEGRSEYTLRLGEGEGSPSATALHVTQDERGITVETGVLCFTVRGDRFSLVESASLAARSGGGGFEPSFSVIRPGMAGDAVVRIRECFLDEAGRRRIYGLGGDCRASIAGDSYRLTVEEAGPLRTVLRCDGKLEADIPAGHYAGYCPFHFTTRIHAYAGRAQRGGRHWRTAGSAWRWVCGGWEREQALPDLHARPPPRPAAVWDGDRGNHVGGGDGHGTAVHRAGVSRTVGRLVARAARAAGQRAARLPDALLDDRSRDAAPADRPCGRGEGVCPRSGLALRRSGDAEPESRAAARRRRHPVPPSGLCLPVDGRAPISGDRASVVEHLIEKQDWSEDPRYRGAVEMSPTALSYHFFGVPFLLSTLRGAGIEPP